jgi:hypothetical protein
LPLWHFLKLGLMIPVWLSPVVRGVPFAFSKLVIDEERVIVLIAIGIAHGIQKVGLLRL